MTLNVLVFFFFVSYFNLLSLLLFLLNIKDLLNDSTLQLYSQNRLGQIKMCLAAAHLCHQLKVDSGALEM